MVNVAVLGIGSKSCLINVVNSNKSSNLLSASAAAVVVWKNRRPLMLICCGHLPMIQVDRSVGREVSPLEGEQLLTQAYLHPSRLELHAVTLGPHDSGQVSQASLFVCRIFKQTAQVTFAIWIEDIINKIHPDALPYG
jgi:hypothetical protein